MRDLSAGAAGSAGGGGLGGMEVPSTWADGSRDEGGRLEEKRLANHFFGPRWRVWRGFFCFRGRQLVNVNDGASGVERRSLGAVLAWMAWRSSLTMWV